jgi:hypothetical protein
LKSGYVERGGSIEVELDRAARDVQEGRGVRIADGFAQIGQRVSQMIERRCIGHVRPQQAGQRLTAVRPIGFYGQIGQQRARGVHAEVVNGLPVQSHLKCAQK